MAVVGMVWDATTTGYRHLRISGLQSMTAASPSPSATEISRPMPVTAMVAGRWTVNSGSRSSQIFRRIWMGVGKI